MRGACETHALQDPHPTDAGYRAKADAFMAASGYPRQR